LKFRYVSQQQKYIRALSAGIGKTAVILPAAFITETGLGMLTLGMIFFMREVFQLSPGMVGWIAATWQGCYVVGCLTMRPAFETLRPRYLMILSSAGMSLSVLAILISRSVSAAFLFYGLFGFCMSFFWPPLLTWLSFGSEGGRLSRAMARLTITGSVGIVISPFLAGALSTISPRYPLYGATALFAINCIFLVGAAVSLPRIRADKHRDGGKAETGKRQDQSTFLRYPAWIGLLVTYTVLGIIITVFPMYARDELSLSKSAIGTLLLVRALISALTYVVIGRTKFWHFRALPMSSGLALLGLFVFSLSRVHSPFFIGLSLALIGPLISLGFSYSFFHGASGASRRAIRMAIHEALLASGLITGSAVGGQLYQRFDMSAVGLFCVALVTVAVLAQILLVRAWKAKESAEISTDGGAASIAKD